MPIVDMTWLSYLTFLAVGYYLFLFVIPFVRRSRPIAGAADRPDADLPMVVLVVPAHNEEAVIEHTIESLLRADYPHKLVLVMNDGSHDRTSDLARPYEATGQVHVIDRGPEVAGQGKGEVLNHAFALITQMAADEDPRLKARRPDDIVIGILDADGQLEPHALRDMAPYFADPSVGGVQIGVRIANARDNLLARMQDMEFVGFSGYVQEARDLFGSVGLGGNGQFTRLAALQSLDRDPWTRCLTEDLDLSLALVQNGWRNRFCPTAFVAQQGLTRLRPMLRQRTRWVQGHYQCWRHLPSLLRNEHVPLATRIDLGLYLTMITFVMIVFSTMLISLTQWTGAFFVVNHSLDALPVGPVRNLVSLLISFGPPLAFLVTYQRRAAHPLAVHEMPAYLIAFSLFGWHWVASQLWAFARMATGRGSWAKTPRVRAEMAV